MSDEPLVRVGRSMARTLVSYLRVNESLNRLRAEALVSLPLA
jgi:hypothetical protein